MIDLGQEEEERENGDVQGKVTTPLQRKRKTRRRSSELGSDKDPNVKKTVSESGGQRGHANKNNGQDGGGTRKPRSIEVRQFNKFKRHDSIEYTNNSLFIFAPDNPVRVKVTQCINSSWFNILILGSILANSILLCFPDPVCLYCLSELDGESCQDPNLTESFRVASRASLEEGWTPCTAGSIQRIAVVDEVELFFTGLFTIELLFKVIAMGFIRNKHAYLRDPWNVVDFVVVVAGYIAIIPGISDSNASNVSSLRTFRLLRPLRTLTAVPGMQVIVLSIFTAVPAMGKVVLLCLVMFAVWGIIGIQLWAGLFLNRCFTQPATSDDVLLFLGGHLDSVRFNESSSFELDVFDERLCALENNALEFGRSCDPVWRNGVLFARKCLTADASISPGFGYANFDNFGTATLTIFVSITLEGWVDVMYNTMDTFGVYLVIIPYFVILIIFGSFFLLNLALAVVWDEYQKASEEIATAQDEAEKEKTHGSSKDQGLGGGAVSDPLPRRIDEETSKQGKKPFVVHPNGNSSRSDAFPSGLDPGADGISFMASSSPKESRLGRFVSSTLSALSELHDAHPKSSLGEFNALEENDEDDDGEDITRRESDDVNSEDWHSVCSHENEEGRAEEDGREVSIDMKNIYLRSFPAEALHVDEETHEMLSKGVTEQKDYEEEQEREMEEVKRESLHGWGGPNSPWIVRMCRIVVQSQLFEAAIIVLILVNTLFLCLESYNAPEKLNKTLSVANIVFTFTFLLEMVVRMVGLGPWEYVADGFNLFDAVVVIVSLIELGLTWEGDGENSSGISAFRTLRLLRIFKLAKAWASLRKVLSKIVYSLIKVSHATILLVLIMFVFALVGMQFFAGRFGARNFGDDYQEWPRANFDNLFSSFVTVFQVLTGENWNEVLYNGMKVNVVFATLYFVLLNVLGNYMILNLFLAILLSQFDSEEIASSKPKKSSSSVSSTNVDEELAQQKEKNGNASQRQSVVLPPGDKRSLCIFSHQNLIRRFCLGLVKHPYFETTILILIGISCILLALDEPYVEECADTTCKAFARGLLIADYIVTTIFLAEMMMKIIAYGLIVHKDAYLRDWWNVLDCTIVSVSVASMLVTLLGDEQDELQSMLALRALRGFRALRVVSRYPGMKLVVNSIFRSLPAIANVSLVCGLFFLIFSIVGVQNWSGALYRCNDPETIEFENCDPSTNFSLKLTGKCGLLPTESLQEDCINSTDPFKYVAAREWEALAYNFDHIGNALLTVFEITSGEMWPNILYDVEDAVGPYQAMQFRYRPIVAVYFIVVIVVCSFLMLNVFVGVVIDNFNDIKAESDGSAFLTHDQRMWVDTVRRTLVLHPKRVFPQPPDSAPRIRHWCYDLCTRKSFEFFILFCIILNTCFMATRHYDPSGSEYWDNVLEIVNIVFSVLFTIEALIKMLAFTPRGYFLDSWNRFDFGLVVLSYFGISGTLPPGLTSLFRTLRVARVFRLVRASKGLRTLFKTLIYSLPQLANVGAILFIIFFIYAIAGMNIFSGIKYGEFLNEYANFDGFGMSMLTLFRMATGESYNGIMHDCMVEPPYCIPGDNCGFPILAPVFFCSFFLISNYVLLNLLIAIILDNFQDSKDQTEAVVSDEHIDQFMEAWSALDPDRRSAIDAELLPDLLAMLDPPLGLKDQFEDTDHKYTFRRNVIKTAKELDIPNHNGLIHMQETLHGLVHRAYGHIELPEEGRHIQEELFRKTQNLKSVRGLRSKAKGNSYLIKEHHAAIQLQAAWRAFAIRAQLLTVVRLRKWIQEEGILQPRSTNQIADSYKEQHESNTPLKQTEDVIDDDSVTLTPSTPLGQRRRSSSIFASSSTPRNNERAPGTDEGFVAVNVADAVQMI